MRIYIYHFNKDVEVKDVSPYFADYIAGHYPKGQIFMEEGFIGRAFWRVLFRSGHNSANKWAQCSKVPSEVLMTQMLLD